MLIPSLLLGLLAVCVILVSIGHGIAVSRTQQLQLQRVTAMGEIVSRAEVAVTGDRADALQSYLDRFLATNGESVAVIDGHGDVVAAAGTIDVTAPDVEALALSAGRAVPQLSIETVRPWSPDHALVAAPFEGLPGVTAGAVVLEVDLTAARADVVRSWCLITVAGLLLLAGMLFALWRWTGWVLRPVDALDAATRALAERRPPAAPDPSGPPELRRLAASFARMAQGVEDALEQQRGFVAEASLQLRNPLAAIRLRIDALPRGETIPDDELVDALTAVDGDLDRLEHIVDRMLVLANAEHRVTAITSGKSFSMRTAAIDLGGTLSIADVLDSAHLPALDVRTEGAELVRTEFGRADLVEIVEILLENAAKYAGDDAVVTVRLAEREGRSVLEVSDNGPGLSDDELDHVGDRFWRSTEHTGLPGTGLGLAIARQLALANGGDLTVDRAEEGGLRVRVWLGAS
ncbi:HAMP domain-containing sensor histidine kinase [Gulosibacter faecalis]|uniref:histidine kinase n=1 Tax=Gulosibacter faecalis TaxID=272240 RepID=A0ABW5UXT6_9MICO|nr:HAMP domain-containing sensor histidine kinase [Gulosibacter faecalis]